MLSREDLGSDQMPHISPAPDQSSGRTESAPSAATGTSTVNADHITGVASAIVQIASGPLVWALLLLIAVFRWRYRLDRIMDAIAERIESGGGLDLGPVKIPTLVKEGFSKGSDAANVAPSKVETISLQEGFTQLEVTEKRVDME
jgi:hypothetical protein